MIAVVGHGMVAHRFVEKLRKAPGGDRLEVAVFGEEPRPAYDRVRLTAWFEARDAAALALADRDWYRAERVELRTGARVTAVDPAARTLTCEDGSRHAWTQLVLATGSSPLVPPIPGVRRPGVFVYRTIEDLEAIAAWAAAAARRCAVLGGGLLGLEAAKAAVDLGLATHVIELCDRLMPRQLDATGSRLLEQSVRALGISLHLGRAPAGFDGDGDGGDEAAPVAAVRFDGGERLPVDLVIVSAGIRPRDELARAAGIAVGPRGGVIVDDTLATSAPDVHAIGEVALHRGQIYGLVAPGYAMADVLARRLALPGEDARFDGADLSAKLKLCGVDVASFGDPFAEGESVRPVLIHDLAARSYRKLLVGCAADGGRDRLLGGILVGDASAWSRLTQVVRAGGRLDGPAIELLTGTPAASAAGAAALADAASVCTCHDVDAGCIRAELRAAASGEACVDLVKQKTRAGTGCGGCVPLVTDLVAAELRARGAATRTPLCEHFDLTRQELFEVAAVKRIDDFDTLLREHGRGRGCEICKPTAASIFASLRGGPLTDKHATLQDSNDRFLANLQRRGLYSVVPRIPGGEITPQKLIRIGQIAAKYGLYTKITGGQRIDLFGARLDQLPDIWEELIEAGFESGHAYGKAMRTVKSCVGTTWCRYGVGDSVGLAIRLEHRYKGLRAPHKLKAAVSGCVRECAEAQSKDFGVIATERGYNLYVCGNGGARPRHADLLAADLDEATLIRLIDRFVMFYIRTADRLTRTSVWLEKLEGGLAHLRAVIVDDSLGLGAELEAQLQALVDGYECEWRAAVRDPKRLADFRAFANATGSDGDIEWVRERGQARPADWPKAPRHALPVLRDTAPATRWQRVARVDDVPRGGGIAVRVGAAQIALFRPGTDETIHATQNMCPHKQDLVLARGLIGDRAGEPKVACPQHKKTFSLRSGACLSGDVDGLRVFPARVQEGEIWLELPAGEAWQAELCPGGSGCEQAPPLREAAVRR